MRPASESDRSLLIDILSASFADNPSTLFVVRRGANRHRRIRRLISYSVRVGLRAGGCYLSDDGSGAAILLRGREKPTTFADQLGLVVGVTGLRRIAPVLRKESYVEARHPTTPFLELWFLGVLPAAQRRGVGSKLLNEIIEIAQQQRLPIYLETSKDQTVAFYLRHGFEVFDEADFGFPFRCMRRLGSH